MPMPSRALMLLPPPPLTLPPSPQPINNTQQQPQQQQLGSPRLLHRLPQASPPSSKPWSAPCYTAPGLTHGLVLRAPFYCPPPAIFYNALQPCACRANRRSSAGHSASPATYPSYCLRRCSNTFLSTGTFVLPAVESCSLQQKSK